MNGVACAHDVGAGDNRKVNRLDKVVDFVEGLVDGDLFLRLGSLKKIREWGFSGLIWGSNAGLKAGWVGGESWPSQVEDFHMYWDSERGEGIFHTSGVHQPWQMYTPKTTLPLICTEWGSTPPGQYRSETEVMFAGWAREKGVQVALSYCWMTRPDQLSTAKRPIDRTTWDQDPVRVSTNRIMALTMAAPKSGDLFWQNGNFRRRGNVHIEINGGWRNTDVGQSDRSICVIAWRGTKKALIYSGIDAQNTGASYEYIRDGVLFKQTAVGGLPVIEMATETPLKWWAGAANKIKEVWTLDTFTGKRLSKLPFLDKGDEKIIFRKGFWVEVVFE